ncbi:MAG TPA: hypothetical protein VGK41_04930, partial [Solirubrobacterales bacterium]
MKPVRTKLLAALLAAALTVPAGAVAATGDLRPTAGTSWQADSTFGIEWDPIAPPDPTEAVYRIYDSQGRHVLISRRPIAQMLKDIAVPAIPDAYTLKAWLQNSDGERGPQSTTILRFDNAAPSAPVLDSPPEWILGTEPAVVGVAEASPPLPLSGISGHALSVGGESGSSPCAQGERCHAAEIDIAGPEGGTISLGTLPEGIHPVRAVAVSGTGVPSQVTTAVVRVDGSAPAVSLANAPVGWSNRPVLLTAHATDPLSGMAAAGPPGPFTALAVDGGAPARALGEAVGAWVGSSGLHAIEYFARDAAG